MKEPFKSGDRVRVRASSVIPAGAIGRVEMKLISVADMYFVQFDGEPSPTLMRADDLEPATDALADADAG